jgi:hypothetical protein
VVVVAIPTAIPVAPLISKVGTLVGITLGSKQSIIKVQLEINRFFSISAMISSESYARKTHKDTGQPSCHL